MISGSLDWALLEADLKTKRQVQVVYLDGDPGVEKGVGEGSEPIWGVSLSRLPRWATRAQSEEFGEKT